MHTRIKYAYKFINYNRNDHNNQKPALPARQHTDCHLHPTSACVRRAPSTGVVGLFKLCELPANTCVLSAQLQEYNECNPRMDLVLFEQAMEHVSRISRIIESPRGNALLVVLRAAAYACIILLLEPTQIVYSKKTTRGLRTSDTSASSQDGRVL